MLLGISLLRYAQKRSWELDRLLEWQKNHSAMSTRSIDYPNGPEDVSDWKSEQGKLDLASQLGPLMQA